MMYISEIAILAIISYLIGSIPTGVWVSRLFFGFDIRTKGSGNMGSTNVFRVLGTKWGVIVQLIDLLKGFVPSFFLAGMIFPEIINDELFYQDNQIYLRVLAGASAIIGHVFPIFIKFKGGKGINTAAGMLFGVAPIEVGFGVIVFLLVMFSSGYISLSSIITGISIPVILLIRKELFDVEINSYYFLLSFFTILAITILITHKSNIKRLINGNENKFEKLHKIKFKRK